MVYRAEEWTQGANMVITDRHLDPRVTASTRAYDEAQVRTDKLVAEHRRKYGTYAKAEVFTNLAGTANLAKNLGWWA